MEKSEIEKRWQDEWKKAGVYQTDLSSKKQKFYTHVMFPYPSGSALHMGHCYNYLPADTFARFKRHQGYEVFCPIGFDAFGLPAENHAIKTGEHPSIQIRRNIENMTVQLSRLGCAYDWEKSLATCQEEYYKWTQWVFIQLFKHGLAKRREELVAWDPVDQTTLAREQILPDGTGERSGAKVVMKPMSQWSFAITGRGICPKTGKQLHEKPYAERLLDGLEGLDWPKSTKEMQRQWIGKSTGVRLKQKVKDLKLDFDVFDTIPQTFLAQTFTVIAPEHPKVELLVKGTPREREVMEFVNDIRAKKAAGRFDIEKDIEGIFTGRYVDNPFGTGDLPIWIASYVLADYGTGIVNCSSHDERDFAFAKKYGIPLKSVLLPEDQEHASRVSSFSEFYREPDGILQEPASLKGLRWKDARQPIIDFILERGIGVEEVNYKIRDWSISRQRYWGAPIPIVYDPEGKPHPVPEEHLPWKLPTDVPFKPSGESPLARSEELKERTETLFGKGWKPEVDTMDTFVCSSFYSIRFLACNDVNHFVNETIERKWMPVDVYLGGVEHATRHLIYARFIQMALCDIGVVSQPEPYQKLVHQGLIQVGGGKMSKSKGNAIGADDMIERYGADVFRILIQSLGPYNDSFDLLTARDRNVEISQMSEAEVYELITRNVEEFIQGPVRFVRRIDQYFSEPSRAFATEDTQEVLSQLHRTIAKVTEDLERLHFNTALSQLNTLGKLLFRQESISRATASSYLILLSPFAPHLAEDSWHKMGNPGFVVQQPWPSVRWELTIDPEVTIPVQINGKLRGTINHRSTDDALDIEKIAVASSIVREFEAKGATISKVIVRPGKIVNVIMNQT